MTKTADQVRLRELAQDLRDAVTEGERKPEVEMGYPPEASINTSEAREIAQHLEDLATMSKEVCEQYGVMRPGMPVLGPYERWRDARGVRDRLGGKIVACKAVSYWTPWREAPHE